MQILSSSTIRALALCVLTAWACAGAPARAAVGQPLTAAEWQPAQTVYSFALYFNDKQGAAPEKLARKLAADPAFAYRVVAKLDRSVPAQPTLMLQSIEDKVATEYKPPSLRDLKYFGRGLTADQGQALQSSPQVLVLVFAHPARDALAQLRKANAFALQLATQTQGLIWDEETREIFTPEYWKALRVDSWEDAWPDATRHITVHAYSDKGKVRSVSLGMVKFALPDLVVSDAAWSLSSPLGHTLNTVAQRLVEGQRPDSRGQMELQVAALQHQALRKRISNTFVNGATGRGTLALLSGQAEEGDAHNALAELRFDSSPGKDTTSRQTAFVSGMFGSGPDEVIVRKKNDGALQEASDRAKAKLPALRAAFQAGLPPGDVVMLKAPFKTASDGTEWMWVEVMRWPGERISGMLRNEPRDVPGLKAGQMVEIKQSEVFDYLRRSHDGKQEGNETSEILSKSR